MRWDRRCGVVSLAVVAFVAPSCKSNTAARGGDDANPTGPDGITQSAGEVGGHAMEAAKDGPWTVRRPKRIARDGEGEMAVASAAPAAEGRAKRAEEPLAAAPPAPPAMAPGGAMADNPIAVPTAAPSNPLKAGSTDDNARFSDFLAFLASWTDRSEVQNRYDPLDVSERRFVRVIDRDGNPVPMARLRVQAPGRDGGWIASTYGDGRAPFYPNVAKRRSAFVRDGGIEVEARYGGRAKTVSWPSDQSELLIQLDEVSRTQAPVKLDVLFVIDTTGSMADEIDRVKTTLLGVTERLRTLKTDFDLQYGAVLYRDVTDDYLTSVHPFTSDIGSFDTALHDVQANGGGDMPESVNQALAEAVKLEWRADAAKVAFLIGDAPPHMDYQGDTPYGESLMRAVGQGIRIHSVAASGLDPAGTLVWRQTAQLTRGKFIFIEYGSVGETAEGHGVAGPVKSNNLDDIVFDQIRDELNGWGKPARDQSADTAR